MGIKTSSFFPLLLDDIRVLEIIGEAYVKSGCRDFGMWSALVGNPLIEGESITIEGYVTTHITKGIAEHRITTAYPYALDVPND